MAAGILPPSTIDCYNSVRQRLIGSPDNSYVQKDNGMSGLIIYVRTKPSSDTEFVQVLLPVALSYETFVCKLCVAFGVQRDMVKKVVKLPDILIRTTEDVIRLTQYEKLEIVLHRSLWTHSIQNKWKSVKPLCSMWSWTLILVFSLTAAVSSTNIMKRFDEMTRIVDAVNERMKLLEDNLAMANSNVQTDQKTIDKIIKQVSGQLRNMENNLLDNVVDLDHRLEKLNTDQTLITTLLQSLIDQTQIANKLQATLGVKRKIKDER